MIEHTFKPIINADSEILILGSFPSEKSREASFYYMHPNNRFWPLLEKIFEADFTSMDISQKINLLHRYHIALYDVVEKCDIEGSKDASIESVVVNPIQSLIDGTKIQQIFLNGRTAEKLFKQYFPTLKNISTYLPSTSSANAQYRFNDLYQAWKIIKQAKRKS